MEEKKRVSIAQKRAAEKYTKANYDEIKVRVPKGKKKIIQQYAMYVGESTTAFINRAIDERMERTSVAPDTAGIAKNTLNIVPEAPISTRNQEKHYKPFAEADAERVDLKELLYNVRYQLDIGMTFGSDVLKALMEKARQQEAENQDHTDLFNK